MSDSELPPLPDNYRELIEATAQRNVKLSADLKELDWANAKIQLNGIEISTLLSALEHIATAQGALLETIVEQANGRSDPAAVAVSRAADRIIRTVDAVTDLRMHLLSSLYAQASSGVSNE